jgi:hypothetical protein
MGLAGLVVAAVGGLAWFVLDERALEGLLIGAAVSPALAEAIAGGARPAAAAAGRIFAVALPWAAATTLPLLAQLDPVARRERAMVLAAAVVVVALWGVLMLHREPPASIRQEEKPA